MDPNTEVSSVHRRVEGRRVTSGRIDELVKVQSDWREGLWFFFHSYFGSIHFLFERARCFPVHERFWFCFVQVATTQFCCFPLVLMARASDGTDVPVSLLLASSSKVGSPNGSPPDLEGTGYRVSTVEEKINEMFVQVAKLLLLVQSVSRFENCVQTLSQTLASYDASPCYHIGNECNVRLQ